MYLTNSTKPSLHRHFPKRRPYEAALGRIHLPILALETKLLKLDVQILNNQKYFVRFHFHFIIFLLPQMTGDV